MVSVAAAPAAVSSPGAGGEAGGGAGGEPATKWPPTALSQAPGSPDGGGPSSPPADAMSGAAGASDDMDVGPGFAGGGDDEEDGFFDPVIEAIERRDSIMDLDSDDEDALPLKKDGVADVIVPSTAAAAAARALVVGRYFESTLTTDDKKENEAAYIRATASPIEIPARDRSCLDDPMAHYQQTDLDDLLRAVMHCATFEEMRPVLDRFKASFRTYVYTSGARE